MNSEQQPSVTQADLWFDIAVNDRGEGFVLANSAFFDEFNIEHHWVDTFQSEGPPQLSVGSYRWHGFELGQWDEDEHIAVSGGTFTPLLTAELRAENERLRDLLGDCAAMMAHGVPMNSSALVAGRMLVAREVWKSARDAALSIQTSEQEPNQ